MTPGHESFETLLSVQALDTRLDQLRHRHDTLPDRLEITEIDRMDADLVAGVADTARQYEELLTLQRKADTDLATLEAKIAEEDRRLYGGAVTSPKEAMSLQEELASLHRHRSQLEDRELEILVEMEPLAEKLESVESERAQLAARRAEAAARVTVMEAEIEVEIEAAIAARTEPASLVDPALLSDYDQLRVRLDGVGIARLEGGRCNGCHLLLSAVEVDRIKSIDPRERVDCEECGRILVRS